MADKLQGLTIFDDEAIGGAQALLLTFTQIQGVNFDRATEAVTDLATVMGTDLDSAAKIVGKSLADPVAGLTALKKAGVIFNDEQKKLVKNLVQTGDTAGAQGVILDALKGKMGSAAEAARNTLGGALQGLQNDFNNLLEGDSGSAGVKGTTQAINDFAATLRSPEVKSGIDSLARGLATLLNLYVKGAAAALTFAQNANAVSGISAETKGQSKSQLQLRKSSLTGQLGRVSEGQDMAVRTAAWQRGTDDVAKLKQLIKADIAEIDAELNRSDYLSNSKDAAFGGAPRRMKFGKPLAASTAPAATGGGGGGSGGGRSSSRSPDNSAALEAARAQEEALEKQKSAAEDFRSTLEELRAEMGGPLAQVTLEYSRKQEELAKLIADGAISTKDAAEAYKILESQRLKEVEAINAQKSPMEELLADMEFENSLMKMNNEERLFAIQTRGMEAESIAKYGDSLKQLNEDAKQTQESIEMMDGFRDATRGLFSDLMDGSKSASDAFKDFVANILDGIA